MAGKATSVKVNYFLIGVVIVISLPLILALIFSLPSV